MIIIILCFAHLGATWMNWKNCEIKLNVTYIIYMYTYKSIFTTFSVSMLYATFKLIKSFYMLSFFHGISIILYMIDDIINDIRLTTWSYLSWQQIASKNHWPLFDFCQTIPWRNLLIYCSVMHGLLTFTRSYLLWLYCTLIAHVNITFGFTNILGSHTYNTCYLRLIVEFEYICWHPSWSWNFFKQLCYQDLIKTCNANVKV